ncbi:MAG: hypothetical protein R6U63_11090, partial [Longimicrobiales bacterium]
LDFVPLPLPSPPSSRERAKYEAEGEVQADGDGDEEEEGSLPGGTAALRAESCETAGMCRANASTKRRRALILSSQF